VVEPEHGCCPIRRYPRGSNSLLAGKPQDSFSGQGAASLAAESGNASAAFLGPLQANGYSIPWDKAISADFIALHLGQARFWQHSGNISLNPQTSQRPIDRPIMPVLAGPGRITPSSQIPHCWLSERAESASALPDNSALSRKCRNSDHVRSIGTATAPNLSVNPAVVFGIIRNLQCLCLYLAVLPGTRGWVPNRKSC